MKLVFNVNRLDFMIRVLAPVARMGDSVELNIERRLDTGVYVMTCVVNANEMSSTQKSQVVLYVETSIAVKDTDIDEFPVRINIANVRTLLSALRQVEDQYIDLIYDGGSLRYESSSISFRFALSVDEVMSRKTVSASKIRSLSGNLSFNLESAILKKLLSITNCMAAYDKMYLRFMKDGVHCCHTDEEIGAADRVDMVVADSFNGDPPDDVVVVSDYVFKIVATNQFDICNVVIADPGVVIFNLFFQNCTMKYIAPKRIEKKNV